MWFQKKEKELEIEYVIVAEFERDTINPILEERVSQLASLMKLGYKVVTATTGLDGSIHYLLSREKR